MVEGLACSRDAIADARRAGAVHAAAVSGRSGAIAECAAFVADGAHVPVVARGARAHVEGGAPASGRVADSRPAHGVQECAIHRRGDADAGGADVTRRAQVAVVTGGTV